MISVTKYPVLVLGAPRTGTTVISGRILKCNPEIKAWFFEPNNNQDKFQKFLEYSKNNNDYLIKLQGIPLATYPTWFLDKLYSKNMYVIKMNRQNVINQITSFYIATVRKKWFYSMDDDSRFVPDEIKIDTKLIEWSIEVIKKENAIVDSIEADMSIAYELIENNMPANILSLNSTTS